MGQCPDNTYFITQDQIDSFDIKYPDCTRLTTNVIISEDVVDIRPLHKIEEVDGAFFILATNDLKSLDGLENLKRVEGNFSIERTQIDHIDQFDGLEYIGGGVRVALNPNLKNLDGLSNLNKVSRIDILANDSLLTFGGAFEKQTRIIGFNIRNNRSLLDMPKLYNETFGNAGREASYIVNNESLLSLKGLDSLKIISQLVIEANPRLKNLEGLEMLKFTDSSTSFFKIINNDSLVTLEGLNGLDSIKAESIQGWLHIKDNDLLESLAGLENLRYLERDLEIENNPKLTDISALSNLRYLGERLSIKNNSKLESLTGIENLERGVLDSIVILNNERLSYCAAKSICEYISDMGNYAISGNAEGCNTDIEILEVCSVGIEEQNINIEIYPNPSFGYIHIEGDTKNIQRVELVDGVGQLVLSMKSANEINLSGLNSGLYYLYIELSDSVSYTYEIVLY